MKKKDFIILSIILIIGFGLRLYKVDIPLADHHSWRQADTAAVARNFARDGFNLMQPRYDDLTSIESGIENPKGYRFVEFPIYNAMFGMLYRYLPVLPVEVYGRIVSALMSLVIIGVLYYLSLKEHSRAAAIFTAITYSSMPFFVFFSRMVLPESTTLGFMMLSLFFLYIHFGVKEIGKALLYFFLSLVFYTLALLVKPTVIFYSLSLIYLFVINYKFSVFKNWKPYAFFILGIIPLALWRYYILQFPEGIPASDWLITHVNTYQGLQNIFFRPAFFRWMFMERIGTNILGIYLAFFLFLGITAKVKKYLIFSLFVSGMAFMLTFQGGNVQHEYYQTMLLPGIAALIGLGAAHLVTTGEKVFSKSFAYPAIVVVFLISFLVSYYRVKEYYHYPTDLTQIAELVKSFTHEDEWIVTDRLGDTTLLYLSDRKGAPAIYKEFPQLKEMGYDYIVTANKDTTEKLKSEGKQVLVESNQFAIIKL